MSGWPLIGLALAGWAVLSVSIGLIVGRIARLGSGADAHLPHSTGPRTPKRGSVHPPDELVWLWPPAVDYHRERRQG